MNRLPEWVMTNKFPSVYDSESGTAIEMVAKVYGAMQNLIKEYNQFAETVNQNIESFEADMKKDFEEFTVGLQQTLQDFIDVIDMKVSEQDQKIADAESYMVTNLPKLTDEAVRRAVANGTITITEVYNPDTESLDMVVTNGGEA